MEPSDDPESKRLGVTVELSRTAAGGHELAATRAVGGVNAMMRRSPRTMSTAASSSRLPVSTLSAGWTPLEIDMDEDEAEVVAEDEGDHRRCRKMLF